MNIGKANALSTINSDVLAHVSVCIYAREAQVRKRKRSNSVFLRDECCN